MEENSHFLSLWKHWLVPSKSDPFEDQSMGVQLVLNQALGIAVPHPEQIGTQCSITVKEQGQEVEHQFEKNMDRSLEQLMVSSYGVFFQ